MLSKEERMERDKNIIEDYKAGMSVMKLSWKYNVSGTTCYKILREKHKPYDYDWHEKRRKEFAARNEEIVQQYKNGVTARELGKKYELSMQRVYAILRASKDYVSQRNGHIETDFKREKKERNEAFLKAYKDNPEKSVMALCQEANISSSLGYLILHQEGIYQYGAKAKSKVEEKQ